MKDKREEEDVPAQGCGGFAFHRGSDPRVATCRGKLQTRRSKLNQEINRELRLRAGAENLFRATTNRKLKETVALELSFVNSNLQLLKEQLAELNSSVELYQGDSPEPTIPMIPLGLKETKEIDFREPFKDFILEHYSEDGANYDEAITEFMDLRQAMRTPQRDASGIALLFQYYNHLYFVERRFFPPDRSLGIYFEWYDSLTGVPSCQRTVAFEKACVLFNTAGLYTQMGAREDRASGRGLDRAVDTFLRAAGALAYLLDNFTNAPSVDLAPPTLTVLITLMLAQARECLFEKLELQSKDKRDIDVYFDLAQEAAQVVEVYREAHSLMAEVIDYLPSSWPALVQVKCEHYSGLSRQRTSDALYSAAAASVSTISPSSAHREEMSSSSSSQSPDKSQMSQESMAKLKGMRKHCEANMVEASSTHHQYTLLGAAHLRVAVAHHEEAVRLQRMCRELRQKRCLSQVLGRAAKQASSKYLASRAADTLSDLIDPPPLPGSTKFQLSLTMPDFGQERVEDLFRKLGPLAVFSAKQHWSAPRSVQLQHHNHNHSHEECRHSRRQDESEDKKRSTASGGNSESGYGFTISTDCPVVVTSVQTNSLAQLGGIKEGDFIVGIGDTDVKWATHDQVVNLINQSAQGVLRLKLVTPMDSNYLRASRTPSKSSKKAGLEMMDGKAPNPEDRKRNMLCGVNTNGSNVSSTTTTASSCGSAATAAAQAQKKHSWNPFKRNRERENALNMILR